MAYVDLESEDGSWADHVQSVKDSGSLTVVDDKDLQIAFLERKLQKANKYIAKLEGANRRLAELIAD